MSVLCRPPFGKGILYLFVCQESIGVEMAVATALRAALLCAAQIEAFDAATVVHDSVFINSHRHLAAKYHETGT